MFYFDPVAKVYSGEPPVAQSTRKPRARVSAPKAPKVSAGKAAEPFVRNGVKIEYDKTKGLFSFFDAESGKKLSTKGLEVIKTPTGVSLRNKSTNKFVSIGDLLKGKKAAPAVPAPVSKAAEPFVKNGVRIEYDKAKGLFSFFDAESGKKLSTKGLEVVKTPTGVSLRNKSTKKFISIGDLLKSEKATKTAKKTVKKAAKETAKKVAKKGTKKAVKEAAKTGLFGKLMAMAKANKIATAIIGLVGLGVATYAISNSGSKRINYEI